MNSRDDGPMVLRGYRPGEPGEPELVIGPARGLGGTLCHNLEQAKALVGNRPIRVIRPGLPDEILEAD